jgi:hypothetical protein
MDKNAETFWMWGPIGRDAQQSLKQACQEFAGRHGIEAHTVYCHAATEAALNGASVAVVPMKYTRRDMLLFPMPAERERMVEV